MAFALSFRKAAVVFAVSSLAILGGTSIVAGCSSSSDDATPDAATNDCPTGLATAVGEKCSIDREVCVVGYVCPMSLNETALCTCTAGAWSCLDPRNNPITDPTAGATCTALGGGNDKECPATENSANFAPCGTPGLLCTYPGKTCPNAPVAITDTCQCQGNNADGGLEYRCDSKSCIVLPDASIEPVDAGHDANGG